MKNFYKVLLTTLFAASLLACSGGEPTLDLSSEDAFESSLQNVMAELDDDEQVRFSDALSAIMMDEVIQGMSEGKSEAEIEAVITERVEGKTAQQIIDEAH